MRTSFALIALALVVGCGRKPPEAVPVVDAVDAGDVVEVDVPDPPLPPDQPIPELPPDPPPALTETGRPRVVLTGDPADPTFAGRKLSEWRADLRLPPAGEQYDFAKIRRALRAMECYGPHAAVAVPDLLALHSSYVDPAVWKALGRRAAVPLLTAALAAPPPETSQAWSGLHHLGPDAAPALARLVALADHPNPKVSARYPGCLTALGPAARPAVPKLVRALDDPKRRASAARALLAVDPTVSVGIPHLLETGVSDKRLYLPDGTIRAYGKRLARPLLAAAVGADEKAPLRVEFLWTTAHLKGNGAGIVPDLIRLARERPAADAPALLQAVGYLTGIEDGPARAAARRRVPDLLALVADPDAKRSFAALGLLGPFGDAAGPAGEHAGRHLDRYTALSTCRVLGQLGPAVKSAVPALLARARAPTPDAMVRAYALLTAARCGADPADLLPVAEALSRDPAGRVLSAATLRRCGPAGAARADVVIRELAADRWRDESDASFWYWILADALPGEPVALRLAIEATVPRQSSSVVRGYLEKLPPEVVPALRELAANTPAPVAELAATELFLRAPADDAAFAAVRPHRGNVTLDAYVQAGAAAVPRLVSLLDDPAARGLAAEALFRLSPDVPLPAAALAAAVRPGAPDPASHLLLLALGRQGDAARPHLDTARAALRSPQRDLSFAAAQVLAALDPADRAPVPLLHGWARTLGTGELTVLLRFEPKREPVEPPALYAGPIAQGWPTQPRYNLADEGRRVLFEMDPAEAVAGGAFDHPRDQWEPRR